MTSRQFLQRCIDLQRLGPKWDFLSVIDLHLGHSTLSFICTATVKFSARSSFAFAVIRSTVQTGVFSH